MPKHVRSIECCYCGASTLVNLHEANAKSLKCGECGAGMAVGKMEHVAAQPDAAVRNDEAVRQLAPQWQAKREWRGGDDDDDDDDDRRKPKKKKGFFDRLEDIWDEVEDIFD
jgi:ribosomal protein S27AE